ncbi:hypothetical protein O7627_25630 [Solwaraspora sp. WMMD1047]|uniref:hypothetical protein n=1 Tax=Solwaraspora sp. WMMD1047 TaxID=3016102 RepID=UPI0024165E03|nr:hypothetical protein [Solwaraspora sp. WMMD1047]MDG4832664.1 hypothetical protein [Solwaraspora sp. WMMD1047]
MAVDGWHVPTSRPRWTVILTAAAVVLAVAAVVNVDDPRRFGAVPAAPATEEGRALLAARDSGRPVRVHGQTSATTEVWARPDGQLEAKISADVVRVRRDGGWVPVDLQLRRATDGSVAPVAHPNELRISGPRPAGTHELATVGHGPARVAMSWTGALPEPRLAGPVATYPEVLPGVDLVVRATRIGFEQLLTVKNQDAADLVRDVPLTLTGPGVAGHHHDERGGIVLTGADGATLATVPAPAMWDAQTTPAGTPARIAPIHTTVTARTGGVDLLLRPDADWLDSPDTVYPVTLDPTVNPLSTTFDAYVRESVTTNQSGTADLQIGLLATSPPTITRSFVTWNAAVLAGKQINSATVHFWNWWSHTCTPKAWEIWSTGAASTATRWTNQPAWLHHEATSTMTKGYDAECDDGWSTINGTAFFQRAATAGASQAHMGIRATDETDTTTFKQFRSRETTATSQVPYAVVTYNSWPTVTARSTVPATACVTGTGRPLVNTLTPQLRATVSDGDGTAMSVEFEWWALGASAPLGGQTVANVTSGATASVTVPAGAFTDGGRYRWRVRANDGVSGSAVWTGFCEMTVYVTVPPVEGCEGGVANDYNGDGLTDVAIADPEASVAGQAKAGQVHVRYGGAGTVDTLHENNAQVPGGAEAGDQFGFALASYDVNNDGCTDLAVGAPYEDLDGKADVGAVYVLLGSPNGLTKGPTSLVHHQGQAVFPETAEAGDWFGFSLAAGHTATGEAFLLIGAPGEDVGAAADTGVVHYLRGTANILLSQGGNGVAGALENDDMTGYALAASSHHFAIGSPGEAIGTEVFAGGVNVLSHQYTAGRPTLVAALDQNRADVWGTSTANDTFGKSLSMVDYRSAGAAAGGTDSFLAVGVPGKEYGPTGIVDTGVVQRFHITDSGFTELPVIAQHIVGIPSGDEEGDYFGERVHLVNLAPGSEATAQNLLLAVSAPGEDTGSAADAGVVLVFGAAANPISGYATVERGAAGLSGTPIAQELIGVSIAGDQTHLYVASPYQERAVYALPWSALATGSATPQHVWRAGEGGFPAAAVAFGAAVN